MGSRLRFAPAALLLAQNSCSPPTGAKATRWRPSPTSVDKSYTMAALASGASTSGTPEVLSHTPQLVRELLGDQNIPGFGRFPCPDEATFLDVSHLVARGSEVSHEAFAIPDNPPVRDLPEPRTTPLHRFVVRGWETINGKVKAACLRASEGGGGVTVSNVGGAFHSPETIMQGEHAAWCPRELIEAVEYAVGLCGSPPSGCSCSDAALTGWFNLTLTGQHAFHALHDHGTAHWSCVYFVDSPTHVRTRSGGVESDDRGHSDLGSFDGCLMLRFQLEPFTHKFAFIAIPPTPGTLLVFPGYVPHAVAPVSDGSTSTSTTSTAARDDDQCQCRLSVAFNWGPEG